jgi:hypothetical protein
MSRYLVQVRVYGYTQIEAESLEDAQAKAEELSTKDFDLSKDCDIDVLDEMDDDG